MEEKVAKAQARANVLDLLGIPPLEAEEDAKGRNIVIIIIIIIIIIVIIIITIIMIIISVWS